MSAGPRRRRALVLLALAVASGGLAASQVRARVQEVEAQVGPLVPVVVARKDLEPETKLSGGALHGLLAVREVPERYAPRDSLAAPAEAEGLTTGVTIAAGSYLTAGQLVGADSGDRSGPALPSGQRAVEVAVAGGDALAALGPGTRADVLVTTEPRSGPGRTFVALENVEILGARPGEAAGASGGESAGARGSTLATLRVSVAQAVYLTAAQNFAREVRLLARSPGDRARVDAAPVHGGRL